MARAYLALAEDKVLFQKDDAVNAQPVRKNDKKGV